MVSTDTETDFCCLTAHPQAEGVTADSSPQSFQLSKEKSSTKLSLPYFKIYWGTCIHYIYMYVCVCKISTFKIHTHNSNGLGKNIIEHNNFYSILKINK